jgi:DNA-directed RNA polymerase subunit RPC12/RpoP
MQTAQRWSGYVCPECRFVFRVPSDYSDAGIACPGCNGLMRIPREGDTPPPLLAPAVPSTTSAPNEEETAPAGTMRRGRGRRSGGDSDNPSWESEGSRIRHGETAALKWFLIVGIPLFFVLLAGVFFALRSPEPPPLAKLPRPAAIPAAPAAPAPDESDVDIPALMKRSEVALLEEAESLARNFLKATRVEEILPLISQPEAAQPRLRRHYPNGTIEPPGLTFFNPGGSVSYAGSLFSVAVTTGDFEQRHIVFLDGPEGLKIDWESWVGWSDMPWDEFIARRPVEPQTFRTTLSQIDYYNFDFTDESRWQSYTLASPDGEHLLYGYAEKDSVLNERLKPASPGATRAVMITLRFAPGATSRQQVIIDSFVADGWVDRAAPTP